MKMLNLGQCSKQGLDLAQETIECVDGPIQGQVHFPGQATSNVDQFGDIKTQPSHSSLGQFGWVIPVADGNILAAEASAETTSQFNFFFCSALLPTFPFRRSGTKRTP